MTKPTIRIEDNGPYHINGDFTLQDELGNEYQTKGEVILCRCGRSHDKPFCDGTHDDIGFESEPRAKDLMVEV